MSARESGLTLIELLLVLVALALGTLFLMQSQGLGLKAQKGIEQGTQLENARALLSRAVRNPELCKAALAGVSFDPTLPPSSVSVPIAGFRLAAPSPTPSSSPVAGAALVVAGQELAPGLTLSELKLERPVATYVPGQYQVELVMAGEKSGSLGAPRISRKVSLFVRTQPTGVGSLVEVTACDMGD